MKKYKIINFLFRRISMISKPHEEAMHYLKSTEISERNPKFREIIFCIDYKHLRIEDVSILMDIYFKLKDVGLRFAILRNLIHDDSWQLKQFFLDTYRKEKYLDMKLMAVRGYANYASQEEVNKIMEHFTKILKKRPESTPYNYQEYEFLRAACGLPYLINKYGYSCFTNAYEQEEKQYNDMPEAFKGHFTYDEECNYVMLRRVEEVNKIIDDYFKQKRSMA
jgi:hypothetical protein